MKIKKLLKDIPSIVLKGSKEVEISGICANSKRVAPGNLFIAKRGQKYDGSQYISDAIAAGALAIATDIFDPSLKDIAQLIHPNVAEIESLLAANYYQHPSQEMFLVGITGTNGKTTTSYLVKRLLDEINGLCGLVGGVEYIVGNNRHPSEYTTPDICTNQKMLREMSLQGCKSAVMEVSSHALDQKRVSLIDFDRAIFTNLNSEHLDYHLTMENYAAAKQKLFLSLESHQKKIYPEDTKAAILNIDDPWFAEMIKGCRAKIFTFGFNPSADLYASELKLSSDTSHFKLHFQQQSIYCSLPLIGRHNVYNYMAAIAVGLTLNQSLEKCVQILQSVNCIQGRLEKVTNSLGLNIYVDFAHKTDALLNVLTCLQELKKGRIITVFGCGGDRDRTKRKHMAKVSEQLSDFTFVTSDNPRFEVPELICQEIAEGFSNQKCYCIQVDREKAIRMALELASKDDIVLIAGKGHEAYQIFAHKTIEFDDRKVASEVCQSLHRK
ncbi:MAG: UDP-N-acetylmuramoyl-L-alanyl-D-glutamate--2,6-diaminopimelate ligase [Parachlamydiaceae bacterium]|nr:UDP-N-acetylmuramoyl-L-alanyl-D-glutamate--2,6-diaminopimelate ligase [Parachlamydiaceae bacterium]